MNNYDPLKTLLKTMDSTPQELAYENVSDHETWYKEAYAKFVELTGYDRFIKVDANMRIEYVKDCDNYREICFNMTVETDCEMVCYLLIPKNILNPPLMVCLQGHTTGVHISLGVKKYDGDKNQIKHSDFGIQAVNNGMAALCIEQRGFGLRTEHPDEPGFECDMPSMVSIMLGRTTIGSRAWDVSRALDVMEDNFKEIDIDTIYIMGNSGGGIAAYYTTCLEPRIKATIPSCSVGSYRDAIAPFFHCVCNHIPNVFRYFEMGDLAGLIAPRPMVVVSGKDDPMWPLSSAKKAYSKIQYIYDSMGAGDNCKLIIGNLAHQFYPDEAWPVFNELIGKKHI